MNINARIAASILSSLSGSLKPPGSRSARIAAERTRKNNFLLLRLILLAPPPDLPAEVDLLEAQAVADRGRGL